MTTAQIQKSKLDVAQLLREIDDLPSIPETLLAIFKVLDDPDSGPSDLSAVVQMDAPLMARILRLANSPYYSRGGNIPDIHRCVGALGYRTVRQVAICVSVATTLVAAVAQARGRMDYRELWRHSVATGAIAKHLAKMAEYPDPEEIFTAGLLHDMGKFVLEIHAPEIYDNIIESRVEANCSLEELEVEIFGCDHAELGAAFGDSWRFPPVLVRCLKEHHRCSELSGPQDREDQAVALVALADYLSSTMMPSHSDLGFDHRLINVATLHLKSGLTINQVEENLHEISEAVQLASGFLDLN
jgi:two-component system, cell cycle response regulator